MGVVLNWCCLGPWQWRGTLKQPWKYTLILFFFFTHFFCVQPAYGMYTVRASRRWATRCCGCWHLLPELLLLTAEPTFPPVGPDSFFFFFFVKWNRKKWRDTSHGSECRPVTPTVLRTFTCRRRIKKNSTIKTSGYLILQKKKKKKKNKAPKDFE